MLDVQGWEEGTRDAVITITHPRLQVMRWWRRTWIWNLSEVPTGDVPVHGVDAVPSVLSWMYVPSAMMKDASRSPYSWCFASAF